MKTRYDRELSLEELAALPDERIDTREVPELDAAFWQAARLVGPDPTQQITLRVKRSVLEAYKATGKGYQTRMNAVLESYVKVLGKG